MLIGAAIGCNSSEPIAAPDSMATPFGPEARATRIETIGCGAAAGRTGSGVAIGDGLVLTVAHLVARADRITAFVDRDSGVPVNVVAFDPNRDLALLRLPPSGIPDVELAAAAVADTGRIVGGAASGTLDYEITAVVELSIEEVLGNDRSERLGYELAATTATGDSGAAAYDRDNRLIGIVFAIGGDGASTWITASSEIDDFVATNRGNTMPLLCDADLSRIDVP